MSQSAAPKASQEKKYTKYVVEAKTVKEPDGKRIVNILAEVTTGTVENAGTDANVSLTIGGRRFVLEKGGGHDDFERGETDTYSFSTSELDLGTLRRARIVLSHDNTHKKPGWYVAHFTLQVLFEKTSYMAVYKRWGDIGWLAKDEDPYRTTSVELQLGDEIYNG